jgi:hypothetical protein
MQFLLGLVVGVIGTWLYRSEDARQSARQRLDAAPEPLQRRGKRSRPEHRRRPSESPRSSMPPRCLPESNTQRLG